MKRAIAFAVAALALPLAVAVHAEEDEAPLTAQWVAIELDGKAVDGPTLAYTTDKVSGTGGCNRFNGPIAIEDDAVQIGPLVSTRMFCEGKSEIESRYFAALEEARAFTLENGKLVLKGENGKVLLKFRK
ncbi:META domain-containing protein [Hyphomicrobium methylovorum]|uniref:META domain-containing protein n=1 Tax=Hyphomicrobium methylovorum TaxID=84 RepID=UPI0015E7216A|nr:META domain-containing protein [Hyphomicrobium methylovorum]MBA2126539.1 META domain-containing protein [Hyphomicrobium methylovorum]